jgi:transposase
MSRMTPAGRYDMKNRDRQIPDFETEHVYLSCRSIAIRWDCSRSSVYRILQRWGVEGTYLGTGKTGMVRWSKLAIEELERTKKQIRMSTPSGPPRPEASPCRGGHF